MTLLPRLTSLTATLALAGALSLAGCQTAAAPRGLPDDAQIEDSYFYGTWKSADGKKDLEVKPGGAKSFKLSITDAAGTRSYLGHLVRVDQQPFAELNMYKPTSATSNKVPVFLYEHVKIEPTQFTIRPLKASWMEHAVKSIDGAAYVSVRVGNNTEGGVVMKDPASMRTLLRKALTEPGSFEDGEVFKKVK